MALFGIIKEKKKLVKKLHYPPKTIILPKKFMKEYKLISDMEHIRDMFQGYKVIEKEAFFNLKVGDGKKKEWYDLNVEGNKKNIFQTNTDIPCGLIVEKDYCVFFMENFINAIKIRSSLYLGIVYDPQHIEAVEEKGNKINLDIKWIDSYGLYDLNLRKNELIWQSGSDHVPKEIVLWYLASISQFLDLDGNSMIPPSQHKPR